MSAWTCQQQGRGKESSAASDPMMEGLWRRVRREARARERHRHTAVVDSLKALDPDRPIREADIGSTRCDVRF